jgi:enamine deaminase RidA (YjgF/YER057c/UK114 family)
VERSNVTKRGLGLQQRGGQTLVFGKGAVAADFVFLSGLDGSVDDDGRPVDGIAAQTELALERMRRYLDEAGTTLENIVKIVWFLPDRALLGDFLAARDAWLERNCPQLVRERSFASTLLVVGLAYEQMLVEFDCIAYAGPSVAAATASS